MPAPPTWDPPSRRPFLSPYPKTTLGWFFWPLMLLLVWVFVGLLWAPLGWSRWRP
jgi:hypothetical protein